MPLSDCDSGNWIREEILEKRVEANKLFWAFPPMWNVYQVNPRRCWIDKWSALNMKATFTPSSERLASTSEYTFDLTKTPNYVLHEIKTMGLAQLNKW